ncbi:MAG TPA: hypothetical protein VK916_07440, partial [Gillisia sp.]|nr:hypothetical protein [Gillisia sp.]
MTPRQFYKEEKERQEFLLAEANRRLNISSFIRLLVFLLTAYGIYFFIDEFRWVALIALAGIAIFLGLVSRHSDLKYKRDKVKELVLLNENELRVLKREFSHLPAGEEFRDPNHPFSHDIDLFGEGSFFQYLNRTALRGGMLKLAHHLSENSILDIEKKQGAIKELIGMVKWRQEFTAVAGLVKTETPSKQVLDWFNNYMKFIPAYMRWLPWVFSGISLLAIVGYATDYLTGLQLFLWFLAGLLYTGIYFKKVNLLSGSVNKVQDTFHQYHQLLALIEKTEFSSEILKQKRSLITSQSTSASKISKKFSRAIDSLEQRNNFMVGVLLNGFMLWDLRQSYKLEKWIIENRQHVKNWFEVIEFIDCFNSLGNFGFNHPDYVFPEITSTGPAIKAGKLSHPLLDPEKRVSNDLVIDNEQFFIITGANMAGKSTFLRTVSLQIVMANTG